MNAFKRDKKEEEEGTYQIYGIYQWRYFWKVLKSVGNSIFCRKYVNFYVFLGFDAT